MEIQFTRNQITMNNKVLSVLDKFVFDFVKILEKHSEYVIVSGYISILFGRTRATEDVDIIIREIDEKKFSQLFKELTSSGYWFINSTDKNELFKMLKDKLAIRIAKQSKVEPNVELKFSQYSHHKYALSSKVLVKIDNNKIWTSPIEQQIAYKLYLGSEKDYLDALQLSEVFKDFLDKKLLLDWMERLEINQSTSKKILGEGFE